MIGLSCNHPIVATTIVQVEEPYIGFGVIGLVDPILAETMPLKDLVHIHILGSRRLGDRADNMIQHCDEVIQVPSEFACQELLRVSNTESDTITFRGLLVEECCITSYQKPGARLHLLSCPSNHPAIALNEPPALNQPLTLSQLTLARPQRPPLIYAFVQHAEEIHFIPTNRQRYEVTIPNRGELMPEYTTGGGTTACHALKENRTNSFGELDRVSV